MKNLITNRDNETLVIVQWMIIVALTIALSSGYITLELTKTDIVRMIIYTCGIGLMLKIFSMIKKTQKN